MPLTKSAIKKQRVDKKRTAQNVATRGKVKTAVKNARANTTPETLKVMYSALDRAVKHHLIAKRQAARLKSRIVKKGAKVTTKLAKK
jgi:ribosomal protein S20